MTFAEMKTELAARGFDYLSSARQGTLINAARAELDRMFLWSWREASATGLSPLAITDLGPIEAVLNTSQSTMPLSRSDWRSLIDTYGDLSTAGTPIFYYISRPAGVAEVATFPSNTDVIGVQYWKITADLVDDTDEPESPAECHYTIVDLAVRRAYRDADDHGNAQMIQQEIDSAIAQFLDSYPTGQQDGPDAYVPFDGTNSVDS